MNALDYFSDKNAAKAYVARRAADAAKMVCLLKWEEAPCENGVLRAELYGHRIWWDVTGTTYDILPNEADDFARGDLRQVLAFILALNW